MRKLRVLSLCDGLGGVRIALDRLNIDCQYYACESNPLYTELVQGRYPDVIELGEMSRARLPRWIDMIVANFAYLPIKLYNQTHDQLEKYDSMFRKVMGVFREIEPKYFLLTVNHGKLGKKEGEAICLCTNRNQPFTLNSDWFSAVDREGGFWMSSYPVTLPQVKECYLRQYLEDVPGEGGYQINLSRNSKKLIRPVGLEEEKGYYHSRPNYKIGELSENGWNLIWDGRKVRRLTPLEYERLQGLPEGWTKGLPLDERYKAVAKSYNLPTLEYLLPIALKGFETDYQDKRTWYGGVGAYEEESVSYLTDSEEVDEGEN